MFDPHGWSEDSYYEALGNLLAFCLSTLPHTHPSVHPVSDLGDPYLRVSMPGHVHRTPVNNTDFVPCWQDLDTVKTDGWNSNLIPTLTALSDVSRVVVQPETFGKQRPKGWEALLRRLLALRFGEVQGPKCLGQMRCVLRPVNTAQRTGSDFRA